MPYLTLYAAWLVAVISPGPDFLAVLRTAAQRGRRAGAIVGTGVVAGIACWATLALTGLSVLLSNHPGTYTVLRALGAVFLIGYGASILWSVLRSRSKDADGPEASAAQPSGATAGSPATNRTGFRLGLATNLANPKAVLFFGALFASVMPRGIGPTAKALAVVGMLVIALAWFTAVAAAAGTPAVMRRYERAQRWIDGAAGALFIGIGIALLPR